MSPAIMATAPPSSSHIERWVGLPVKKRETSELNEWDSLKPKTSSTMPAANNTKPTTLFMSQPPSAPRSRHWGVSLVMGVPPRNRVNVPYPEGNCLRQARLEIFHGESQSWCCCAH